MSNKENEQKLGNEKAGRQEELMRRVREESRSGAPTAGEAVGDIFSSDEIFARIVATADEEFSRSRRLLFLSGLAAGLVMCLSFLGQASIARHLGEDPSRLMTSLLYPIGFVFVVLGRYQLFTENTLTPVTLVLTRIAGLRRLINIWGVVLAANVLGTGIGSFAFWATGIMDPETMDAAQKLASHLAGMDWETLFFKGIVAGWMVAGMVWLNHSARSATGRLLIVFLLMYMVAVADLAHCIVGSSEGLFLVFDGRMGVVHFLVGFMLPMVLGNTVGGVLLVAILNYAFTQKDHFPDAERLGWQEWLFGKKDS